MLPFSFELRSGASVYQQVIYAVKRALASGRLRPGDRFPSVRQLSQELGINPNTAHKVVTALVGEGLLSVRPGIGTVIAVAPPPSRQDRQALLDDELERIVVEARTLALELDDLLDALARHWRSLTRNAAPAAAGSDAPEPAGGRS